MACSRANFTLYLSTKLIHCEITYCKIITYNNISFHITHICFHIFLSKPLFGVCFHSLLSVLSPPVGSLAIQQSLLCPSYSPPPLPASWFVMDHSLEYTLSTSVTMFPRGVYHYTLTMEAESSSEASINLQNIKHFSYRTGKSQSRISRVFYTN
jgi:hypothetical protein